ncbi:hypothetical protein HS088_TW19G00735 [Tripterygium wilfordii]|uniref:Protein COFACTOR ASSEMBLY OF COMPLEX C SUBUNIT B CCB2 chloroplastic n=1 Tax=Tripterygium wilfordii TaxID=458696 RepID=A0A7J7CAL0_TRIWF|nr:protein COFACTOR ASSEMBLY OF COMPLEX C SUBUNIT B CCB2, chloroplastic-like [Tripterygium wilfordii]KAF5731130.1 hypothetical protein HS088_TW19G00735 [Tripterygium wilfordii]
MGILCLNPSIQLFPNIPQFRAIRNTKFKAIAARLNDPQTTTTTENQQQQLNLSVLRFTLGIPGLDESYLPRWIGYGFGSLLILNHFAGSDAASITPAQMRTEALGLSLAAFSIALPYLGRFLKGATQVDQSILPEAADQIFVMSQNISNCEKEDLAWATYVLLRNTNTISVLISVRGQLCVRGYWNTPNDISKGQILDWFQQQIEKMGLSDITDTLYFPQITDSGLGEMLPNGTRSLLVQPMLHASVPSAKKVKKVEGFCMLASSMGYAYSDKDIAWIKAIANKFEVE